MAFNKARDKRHNRIRAVLSGTTERPRVSVYRSNKGIYAQVIDDVTRQTVVSVSPVELKDAKLAKQTQAEKLGELLSKKAKEKKITAVVFDRGGYRYHGRVKAFAESLRNGGLEF